MSCSGSHWIAAADEDEILENIAQCKEAVGEAQPVADPDPVPSARFKYPIDNDSTLRLSIEAFRSALPYLYGTRPRLGEVRLALEMRARFGRPER